VKSSRAWLLALPALLAGLGGGDCSASASPREAEGEPRVRVLLFREPSRVIVSGEGDRRVEVVAVPGGVRANGGKPVASWSGGGAGVLTVRGWRVRGVLRVLRTEEGLAVVNELPIEAYLAGTLAKEMYAGWSPEALRAQAVASRTYALYQCRLRRRESYDVVSGTNSQVYGGLESEVPRVLAAVEATRGEILTHRGSPVLAAFHSASGGRTASAEEVWGEARSYLSSVPVDDEWDSPDTYWRVRISGTTLGRAVAALGHSIGDVRGARVIRRSESGRVREIELTGQTATVTVSGRQLRRALGESTLKSTLFELRDDGGEGLIFVGSGSGHGVGMSQWGARAMAQRGADYREILGTFYPGTRLTRLAPATEQRGLPPSTSGRVGASTGGVEPPPVSSNHRVPVLKPVAQGVGP
jgi:stage II sporulation protein D